jgi:hypothetical protein
MRTVSADALLPTAATLASLASNEVTAAFIMAAPGDSVAKAMLALLEVEDDEGFSNAGGLLHQWQRTAMGHTCCAGGQHLH